MKCKHCQLPITQYWGHLWHDASKVFPQYCPANERGLGSQLHEPDMGNPMSHIRDTAPPMSRLRDIEPQL